MKAIGNTVDFLTKKRAINKGEIHKYCVEENHIAIIDEETWECVQLEMERRRKYMEEHGTNSDSHNTENNPFASKIICGNCNHVYVRKGWKGRDGIRKVWQCSDRYRVKGVVGCCNRHVDEETLKKAYTMAWNHIVDNRENFMEKWYEQTESNDLIFSFRAKQFIKLVENVDVIENIDLDLILKTLDYIKVFEDGMLLVRFLEGTEIECKSEEE